MKVVSFLDSSFFGTWSNMRLTTNKPASLGLISSSLEEEEDVREEVLLGEEGEECSLSTFSLVLKIMFLLVGQFEAICL